MLTLEIAQTIVSADLPQARYAVLTPDRLRGRGVGPALSLLKLLLSRPHRFAPADWLLEQFCHEREPFASRRLDKRARLLRSLLCPPAYESLCWQIVAHSRAMGGAGYLLLNNGILRQIVSRLAPGRLRWPFPFACSLKHTGYIAVRRTRRERMTEFRPYEQPDALLGLKS